MACLVSFIVVVASTAQTENPVTTDEHPIWSSTDNQLLPPALTTDTRLANCLPAAKVLRDPAASAPGRPTVPVPPVVSVGKLRPSRAKAASAAPAWVGVTELRL